MKCDENCFECKYDDCIWEASERDNAERDKEKRRAYSKAYYESHKDYYRQKSKEWWAAHPEKAKEQYAKNRDYHLQRRREHYYANKEKAKAYYEEHKEYYKQKGREWREAHPEKIKEYSQRQKEKRLQAASNRV